MDTHLYVLSGNQYKLITKKSHYEQSVYNLYNVWNSYHWSPISQSMHHPFHWSPVSLVPDLLVPHLIGTPSYCSPKHWSPNPNTLFDLIGVPSYWFPDLLVHHWSSISLVPFLLAPNSLPTRYIVWGRCSPSHWATFLLVLPASTHPNGLHRIIALPPI